MSIAMGQLDSMVRPGNFFEVRDRHTAQQSLLGYGSI